MRSCVACTGSSGHSTKHRGKQVQKPGLLCRATSQAGQSPKEPTRSVALPPLVGAGQYVQEVALESLSSNIRPLGQLDESFIVAIDDDGLLLIDQHVAHERILFDKYRALETTRSAESQSLCSRRLLTSRPHRQQFSIWWQRTSKTMALN